MAVVEWQERRVETLHLVIHCLDVRSYASLVAKAPEYYTRMVFVALHERCRPVNMCLFPCWVFTHILVGISVAMTLLVCLVHDIHAISVAELIQILTVRIVTGTQEVDVCLLHQGNIFLICSVIYISSCSGVMVVTVHSAQFHVLAVHLKHLSYTFHSLNPEMIVKVFRYIALIVNKFYAKGIEIRFGS